MDFLLWPNDLQQSRRCFFATVQHCCTPYAFRYRTQFHMNLTYSQKSRKKNQKKNGENDLRMDDVRSKSKEKKISQITWQKVNKHAKQYSRVKSVRALMHTIRTHFYAIEPNRFNRFESNKNEMFILRKIKWKILFAQSTQSQLQWKFCMKISSGIDSILLKNQNHMKRNKIKRRNHKEEEENEERQKKYISSNNKQQRIMCGWLWACICYKSIVISDGDAGDAGIFKTVISNVLCSAVIFKRPPQVSTHSWRCSASSSILNDRTRVQHFSGISYTQNSLNSNFIGFWHDGFENRLSHLLCILKYKSLKLHKWFDCIAIAQKSTWCK